MNMMLIDSIDVPYTYTGNYTVDGITGPVTDTRYLYIVCRYKDVSLPPEIETIVILYALKYNGYGDGYTYISSCVLDTAFYTSAYVFAHITII